MQGIKGRRGLKFRFLTRKKKVDKLVRNTYFDVLSSNLALISHLELILLLFSAFNKMTGGGWGPIL